MTFLLWLQNAVAWVKKHWQWIVLPVGALLWVAGRSSKKTTVTVESTGLGEHETVREQLEREGIEKLRAADAERQHQLDEIQKKNAAALKEINDATEKKAAELQNDPEKLNAFLKQVGKDVRGKSES